MSWELYFTKAAKKDAKKLLSVGLKPKAEQILEIIKNNPLEKDPPYEKLKGDLDGFYSRRINIQRRIVYQIIKDKKAIKVLRMWTHYE